MRKKLNFQLNCSADEALEHIETATHPCIEKACGSDDEVRLYMMRESKGVRYVEYVFNGKLSADGITGELKTPSGDGDRPGVLKICLLAFMSVCVLAAVFGAIYLFVLVFARNFWLAFYIAMPVFGGLFALIGLLAFLQRRKKKQLANLRDFLGNVVKDEPKKRSKK